MLKRARNWAAAAGTAAVLALGLAVPALTAGTASASSLSCTSSPSCGGATLLYSAKGSLDLSVLNPDPNTNGGNGYWNEEVGFGLSSTSSLAEDFRVAQVTSGNPFYLPGVTNTVAKGGSYGLGDYVAIFDPSGKPASMATSLCLSVEDTYPVVRGHVAQRWALVLRGCNQVISGFQGTPAFTAPATTGAGSTTDEWTVANPDPYQVWSPVETGNPASLEFQNVGLNNASLRHGYAGDNFVIDDRGFGGAGTWGLAFPENDGLNQRFTINGCSDPVASFNPVYWNCVTGPPAAPASLAALVTKHANHCPLWANYHLFGPYPHCYANLKKPHLWLAA